MERRKARLTIDGQLVVVTADSSILEAAKIAGIYIPVLCAHPNLPPARGAAAALSVHQGSRQIDNTMPGEPGKGCGLCLVEVEGQQNPVAACDTPVRENMVVITNSVRIHEKRRETLTLILSRHPHACLTCGQRDGCSRGDCSGNVPENERCCDRFGHCELRKVAEYIGIPPSTPKWTPPAPTVIREEPLMVRNYHLCIGCTRCVRACRDLRAVEAIGFVYDADNRIQIGSVEPTLADSGCNFCTACVAVCPTGALTDKALWPGKKEENIVPCRSACPAGVDVPAYLRLIAAGKPDKAAAVIREKVPLSGVLGRICAHPCETACRRGDINTPIAICALKRYAVQRDKALGQSVTEVSPKSGKKIAVVGAGPAGLTAAFYLNNVGHSVTIFDADEKAGGMLRHGIPEYRLPRDVLEQEIDDILNQGIPFKPNRVLGKNLTLEALEAESYDAVFLALGARLSRRLPLVGCNLPDVLLGLDFLRRVSLGEPVKLKENVVVIGGGGVAVDVALTALRCGAKNVSIAFLESKDEMPAAAGEISGAIEEGINFLPSLGPEKIITENGQVTGLNLVECTRVFDTEGNFNPQFNLENSQCLPIDHILLAVGQTPDLSFLANDTPIQTRFGLIVVNENTLETTMRGVYAGGDVVGGPQTVVHAVAAGRKAAVHIDRALGGMGEIDTVLFERPTVNHRLGRNEGFSAWPREPMPEIALSDRIGFKEIALGYDTNAAIREASRCLQCDLRLAIGANPSPPTPVRTLTADEINRLPESEGVFQLLDEDRKVIAIEGTANLRAALIDKLEDASRAAFFEFEEGKMFSKRESELIQQYLQEHGKMPGNGDEDELFGF